MAATRNDIVRVARSYLGTPFHHMGRSPGAFLDCAGVLVCAARELGLVAADFDVPAYRSTPDGHSMVRWCDEYLQRIEAGAMQPGDAVLLVTQKDPQHLGVLGDYRHGGLSIIHAANGATPPRVIETRLLFSRNQRLVTAFAFPGVV